MPGTTVETGIVTPAQRFGAVSVNGADPVQPFRSFAVIVKDPEPRLLKLPEDWKAPPLRLNVKPELPEATALMLPSLTAEDVGLTVVPVTLIVIPVQTFVPINIKLAEPEHPATFLATIV